MKRIARYMLVVTALAVGYAAWVMLGRYMENRRIEERDRLQREAAGHVLPSDLSGTKLKILQFYAVPAQLRPREKGKVCYSVVNAKSLRLDPPVEAVWPSLSRCFEVAPEATTRYRLTAQGNDGSLVSESFVLKVVP